MLKKIYPSLGSLVLIRFTEINSLERQILYIWNLKQNQNQIDIENKLVVAKGEGWAGVSEMHEGVQKV